MIIALQILIFALGVTLLWLHLFSARYLYLVIEHRKTFLPKGRHAGDIRIPLHLAIAITIANVVMILFGVTLAVGIITLAGWDQSLFETFFHMNSFLIYLFVPVAHSLLCIGLAHVIKRTKNTNRLVDWITEKARQGFSAN